MIDLLTSNEIVRYRALGLSLDNIAKITDVSKPTAATVCKQRADDITQAKLTASQVAATDTAEAITRRKVVYGLLLDKAYSSLLTKDFDTMKPKELAGMIHSIERSLYLLNEPSNIKSASEYSNISDDTLRAMLQSVAN
ncbi:hypothetical protein H6792_00860 [Candidatus Nomurabacteria bacterium]|nr:hypothetical protein [Candidatus Nomurabacteria bacterium]